MGKQRLTYCSGLWQVEGNGKRSMAHYMNLLPGMLDMIAGGQLRFWSNDSELLTTVADLCAARDITCDPVHLEIAALPGRSLALPMVEGCAAMALDALTVMPGRTGEKGVAHFRRDLSNSGPEAYGDVLSIWMSKVGLAATYSADAQGDRPVAWIDASISRFNGNRENWNFTKVLPPPGKLAHYGSNMCFFGALLPLNAAFLCAEAETWQKVNAAFIATAKRAARMPYGHDEETVLSACLWEQPELFSCIGMPFPKVQKSVVGRLRQTFHKWRG